MLHEYLIGVQKYFGGEQRLQVLASGKEEARIKGLQQAEKLFGKDNIIKDSIRVIRKLKPSFGQES